MFTITEPTNGQSESIPLLGPPAPKRKNKKWTTKWNCPLNAIQFVSVVECVHKRRHDIMGPYTAVCEGCCLQYEKDQSGCANHAGNPAIRRRGSPSNSTLVNDTTKRIKYESEHVTEGCKQVTPSDFRKFRDYCINSASWYNYQLFIMFLVAIELFLRKTEFCNITEDSFNISSSVLTGPYILQCLNLKLKVKRTSGNQHTQRHPATVRFFDLWGDDECPDLDVKRLLFAFLYAIKWKGIVFPDSDSELTNVKLR